MSRFIISPLPQAIMIATVTDAAKVSGNRLMDLNFFSIRYLEEIQYIINIYYLKPRMTFFV